MKGPASRKSKMFDPENAYGCANLKLNAATANAAVTPNMVFAHSGHSRYTSQLVLRLERRLGGVDLRLVYIRQTRYAARSGTIRAMLSLLARPNPMAIPTAAN